MPKVHFVKEKKTIEIPEGANLRKEARRNGIRTGRKVLIRKGAENVNPQSAWERMRLVMNPLAFFARIGHEQDMRLAGDTKVYGDIEVETQPGVNWHGERFWG